MYSPKSLAESPRPPRRVSQAPGLIFPRALSPTTPVILLEVRRLRLPVASPPMSGFLFSGRLATPTLRNEAESGSLALQLTLLPHKVSPVGIAPSRP